MWQAGPVKLRIGLRKGHTFFPKDDMAQPASIPAAPAAEFTNVVGPAASTLLSFALVISLSGLKL